MNEKMVFMHTRDCLSEMAQQCNAPLKCSNCEAVVEEARELRAKIKKLEKKVRALEEKTNKKVLHPVPTPVAEK